MVRQQRPKPAILSIYAYQQFEGYEDYLNDHNRRKPPRRRKAHLSTPRPVRRSHKQVLQEKERMNSALSNPSEAAPSQRRNIYQTASQTPMLAIADKKHPLHLLDPGTVSTELFKFSKVSKKKRNKCGNSFSVAPPPPYALASASRVSRHTQFRLLPERQRPATVYRRLQPCPSFSKPQPSGRAITVTGERKLLSSVLSPNISRLQPRLSRVSSKGVSPNDMQPRPP